MGSAKKAVKKAKKAGKKVKKAVKKPKKKKKKVSKIAKGRLSKVLVLRGKKEKTVGGLTAKDLVKNKYGKVVSKKVSAKSKKSPWIKAVADARSALKLKGFVAVKKGSPLYAKAKSLYKPKADIELLAAEAAPEEEDEEEQDDDEEQEQDEQDDESEDDIELLAANAAPEDEDEEEQEQEEQDDDEEQEQDDDESQDDVELLAAKSKGKVKKAAKTAKKAVKKAKKAAKKAKKVAKKPKKKVSKIAKGKFRKVMVLRGKKEKTVGGLKATDLIKNKYGRVVSKKASAKAKKSPWIAAVNAARKALNIKGFQAIKKGSPLYVKAKALYK